jgi:flagellar hook-length control protein FliK
VAERASLNSQTPSLPTLSGAAPNAAGEEAQPIPDSAPVRLPVTAHTPGSVAGQLVTGLEGEEGQWVTVALHPADIGPLQIRVDRAANSLSAEIFATDPQTLAWLDQNREALLESMRGEGMTLDSLSLSAGLPDSNHDVAGHASGEPGQEPESPADRAHQNPPAQDRAAGWKHRPADPSSLIDLVA